VPENKTSLDASNKSAFNRRLNCVLLSNKAMKLSVCFTAVDQQQ